MSTDQLNSLPAIVFGLNPQWVAAIVFMLSYGLIISERINRSIIALLGAGTMIITGLLTQQEAIRGIDFNTIILLTGMMVLVSISRRCGMYEYLAVWSAKKGRAQPWAILAMLSLVTAILSALLDNVTTVLLIAPVTLAATRQLEIPAYPFLFAGVFASNIGGTATLIGDPPNIIIGSAGGSASTTSFCI
jgi:Na+/H+ antiporter NhaD/arsenite permease-like protein